MSATDKFLSIEGGDGAGKSTAARALYERLVIANVPVLLVHYRRPKFLREHVEKFMAALETVLLGPRHLLTDHHWVHLTSAWYHVIDEYLVRPALARGEVVIADSWYHKPLLRFRLQGPELFEEARRCFSSLEQPGLVCMLDLDPEIAASRKESFTFGETGNFEGPREWTRENFLAYQRRVREGLRRFGAQEAWQILDVGSLSPEAVADAIEALIRERGWL